jgi:hypothetical protein
MTRPLLPVCTHNHLPSPSIPLLQAREGSVHPTTLHPRSCPLFVHKCPTVVSWMETTGQEDLDSGPNLVPLIHSSTHSLPHLYKEGHTHTHTPMPTTPQERVSPWIELPTFHQREEGRWGREGAVNSTHPACPRKAWTECHSASVRAHLPLSGV